MKNHAHEAGQRVWQTLKGLACYNGGRYRHYLLSLRVALPYKEHVCQQVCILCLLYMQSRSSLRHVTEEPLQPIPGNELRGRKNSQEKKLKKSLESVAVTASTTMHGSIKQSLPQLERGGVTGECHLHLLRSCYQSSVGWRLLPSGLRHHRQLVDRICWGNSDLHASFCTVCIRTDIQPYPVY